MNKKIFAAFGCLAVASSAAFVSSAGAIDNQRSLTQCHAHTALGKASKSPEAACRNAMRSAVRYVAAKPGCWRAALIGRRVRVEQLPIGGGRFRPAQVCRLTIRVCCKPIMRAPRRR